MHLFYNQQYNKLRGNTNPNIHELEQFLNANEAYEQAHKLRALKLKYKAMTTVPTTIEKTMTPYQLYKIDNPLWAAELSALGIESFLDLEDDMKYNLDLSEGIYLEPSGSTYKLSKLIFEQTYEYEVQNQHLGTTDFSSYYPKLMMEPDIMAEPNIMKQPNILMEP